MILKTKLMDFHIVTTLYFFFLVTYAESDGNVIVETKSGKLQGKVLQGRHGNQFNAFRGIPYAKPPTGDYRFKPPVPADPWDGILDATSDGSECPQPSLLNSSQLEGNEDCLFLNVYIPLEVEITKSLPVLVYIHGGGFYIASGNSKIYGAEKFMKVGVVLVTLNYRLGALGFLSTGDENAPGNYGMLDMVQALHWIKENIADFGGDPNKVTIFGMSAGGASVTYLVLSPLAKGLFHAAIAQSGTPLAPWSFQSKPLVWAKRLAEHLECPTVNTTEIVQCIKRTSVEDIIRGTEKLHMALMFPMFHSPVVDSGFLPDDPFVLLKEGKIASKVPFICGVVRDEGIGFYLMMVTAGAFKTKGQAFLDGPEFSTAFLIHQSHVIKPNMKAIETLVKEEYFAERNMDNPMIFETAISELLSDTMFDVGADLTLRFMALAGVPTYAYFYNHKSPLGMITSGMFGPTKGDYIGHADELSVQFEFRPIPRENDVYEDDEKMSKLMNTVWRNVADTTDPTSADIPQWPRYNPDRPKYLVLNLNPSIKEGVFSERTQFWTDFIPRQVALHHYSKEEL